MKRERASVPKSDTGPPSTYQASEREKGVIVKHLERWAGEDSPQVKALTSDKGISIAPNHPDKVIGELLLKNALGTTNPTFYHGILSQLADIGFRNNQVDEEALNFLLSIVKAVKPRDELEAMLGVQMAATHRLAMLFAKRVEIADCVPELDSVERTLNKLLRSFTTQLEALKRYRAGGEQTVNVSVSEGGQAIVGHVTQPPRENAPDKPAAASPPVLSSNGKTTPMPT